MLNIKQDDKIGIGTKEYEIVAVDQKIDSVGMIAYILNVKVCRYGGTKLCTIHLWWNLYPYTLIPHHQHKKIRQLLLRYRGGGRMCLSSVSLPFFLMPMQVEWNCCIVLFISTDKGEKVHQDVICTQYHDCSTAALIMSQKQYHYPSHMNKIIYGNM